MTSRLGFLIGGSHEAATWAKDCHKGYEGGTTARGWRYVGPMGADISLPGFWTARRVSELRARTPWAPFGYHGRRLRAAIQDLVAVAPLPPRAAVLDYGCADRPYERDLSPDTAYVGADLQGNPDADLVLRDDGTVPLADEGFDLVLSTQVLEHVEDPVKYLAECHRVLKPGGSLVLSTHGVMYYHRDPEDYWRWTPVGLHKILAERGFEVMEMRGVLGLAAAAVQIFQDATYWKVPKRLKPPYALTMQTVIALLDRCYSEPLRAENSLTIAVRASRPPDAGSRPARGVL